MSTAAQLEQADARPSRVWSAVLDLYLRGAPTAIMRFLWLRNPRLPFRELRVVGRRSGRERRLLVNVIEIDGRRFIGHPNGRAQWTLNLAAAGACTLVDRAGAAERVRVVEVSDTSVREAIIAATTQLPAPSGRIYRAAGRHIRAVGRFFELAPAREVRS